MWEIRIQHEGLRASRVLHGQTQADAQWKATAQLLRWDARWSSQQRAEAAESSRLTRQRLILHGHAIAARLTAEATAHRLALNSLLDTSLQRGRFLQWHQLKDTTPFTDPPILPEPPRTPAPQLVPELYAPNLTLLDTLLRSRRARKELAASAHFASDLAAWQLACRRRNRLAAETYALRKEGRERNSARHRTAQLAQHAKVDETETAFKVHEKDAVEYFFSEILSRSAYPSSFPEDTTLQYIRSTRTLVAEYELPAITAWPLHEHLTYDRAHNLLHKTPATPAARIASYNDALFQIALRVLSELFTHDDIRALDRIALNGWVRSLDKSTGNMVHVCVLSIVVPCSTFTAIKLAQAEPRACFLKLRGRMSARPIDLVPVKPLLSLTHEDNRFEANDSEAPIDLASMNRSDFETLIHEAFEREFRKNRSQVGLPPTVSDISHEVVV